MQVIVKLIALFAAVPLFAQTTTNEDHLRFDCATQEKVYIRFFTSGAPVDTNAKFMTSESEIVIGDRRASDPTQRHAASSASSGCVRGEVGRGAGGQFIALFRMPCGSGPSFDVTVDSVPGAEFAIVRRTAGSPGCTDPVARSLAPQQVRGIAHDEQVTIEAFPVDFPAIRYKVDLPLGDLQRNNAVTFRKIALREKLTGRGQQGQGASLNQELLSPLQSLTITADHVSK